MSKTVRILSRDGPTISTDSEEPGWASPSATQKSKARSKAVALHAASIVEPVASQITLRWWGDATEADASFSKRSASNDAAAGKTVSWWLPGACASGGRHCCGTADPCCVPLTCCCARFMKSAFAFQTDAGHVEGHRRNRRGGTSDPLNPQSRSRTSNGAGR